MTGLLVLGVFGLWIWGVFKFSRWVGGQVAGERWRWPIAALVFVALLPLPVADEIVGKWQFNSLCKRYAVQTIDEQHIANRRLVYERRGADQFAEGTAVEIRIDPTVFRDAQTNQVLVSYHTVHATGGWLIRALGISETNSPLLFPRACGPKDEDAFKKRFNVTIIN